MKAGRSDAAAEAVQLRCAMAALERAGGVGPSKDKMLKGMTERSYTKAFSGRKAGG
jgi:hypothetical protein